MAGNAGSGDVPDAGPSASAVCTEFAEAACDKFEQCTLRIFIQYESQADCVEASKSECMRGLALNTRWSVTAQSACNAVYAAGGCEALFDFPSECRRPAGDKAVDMPCFSDDECVAGASCVAQPGRTSACGVCKVDADVGATCGNGVACRDGLRCSGTCYEPSQAGEGCYSGALCDFPLVCGETGDPCHAPRQLGATCGPTIDDCDQLNAVHCNAATNRCENVLIVSNLGDSCGFDSTNGASTVCGGGLLCSGNDIDIDLCNRTGSEGQGCQIDAEGNDPCRSGLYCETTCKRAEAIVCE